MVADDGKYYGPWAAPPAANLPQNHRFVCETVQATASDSDLLIRGPTVTSVDGLHVWGVIRLLNHFEQIDRPRILGHWGLRRVWWGRSVRKHVYQIALIEDIFKFFMTPVVGHYIRLQAFFSVKALLVRDSRAVNSFLGRKDKPTRREQNFSN